MKSNEYFEELKVSILEGMESYMEMEEEDDVFEYYTQDDIDECGNIINEFVETMLEDEGMGDDEILEEVERVVVRLNSLNDKCEGALIETDQREGLCELIIETARVSGFDFTEKEDDDITAEWRTW